MEKINEESPHHLAKLLAEAEAVKASKIITTKRCGVTGESLTVIAYIVSVKTKILVSFRKATRLHVFERSIVENSEVSELLIESASENSLLNERSKTLMPAANRRQVSV